jgi:hypothetical protein
MRWDPNQIAEHLFRIREFRVWIDSNVLFPRVPDSVVKPLRQQLLDVEHQLMTSLYDGDEIDRIAALRKALHMRADQMK